jgi:hypothetical protein
MTLKLALLKSGEQILSDIKELVGEDQKVFAYLFNDPVTVRVEYTPQLLIEGATPEELGDLEPNQSSAQIIMTNWIRLSMDKEMIVPLDWVVTIVSPVENLINMYNQRFEQ